MKKSVIYVLACFMFFMASCEKNETEAFVQEAQSEIVEVDLMGKGEFILDSDSERDVSNQEFTQYSVDLRMPSASQVILDCDINVNGLMYNSSSATYSWNVHTTIPQSLTGNSNTQGGGILLGGDFALLPSIFPITSTGTGNEITLPYFPNVTSYDVELAISIEKNEGLTTVTETANRSFTVNVIKKTSFVQLGEPPYEIQVIPDEGEPSLTPYGGPGLTSASLIEGGG